MIGLDLLVNAANIAYLASYSVRDIFWLRVLTVAGGFLLLPYYYLQDSPLWVPIAWNTFFIGINVTWIVILLLERRPVPFTAEDRRLYNLALRALPERDAYNFLRMAEREHVPLGTTLIEQGQKVDRLSLIVEGAMSVDMGGANVDHLGDGSFLGSTAFLGRKDDFLAPVTVRAEAPTTILVWKFDRLEAEFGKNAGLEVAVEASLGLEISRWLKIARQEILRA